MDKTEFYKKWHDAKTEGEGDALIDSLSISELRDLVNALQYAKDWTGIDMRQEYTLVVAKMLLDKKETAEEKAKARGQKLFDLINEIKTVAGINAVGGMLKTRASALKAEVGRTLNVGDKVSFSHKGIAITGTIVKVKTVTADVLTDTGTWKVSTTLLTKIQ